MWTDKFAYKDVFDRADYDPVNDDPYGKRARQSDRSSTPESRLYEIWADADVPVCGERSREPDNDDSYRQRVLQAGRYWNADKFGGRCP